MTDEQPAPAQDEDRTLVDEHVTATRGARRAERPTDQDGTLRRWASAFARWRRTRPFWGGIVLALGGWFVITPVLASYEAVVAMGGGGMIAYVLGGGMIAAAVVAVISPAQRHFPAIMGVIFAVASLAMANLGGWLVGMLLGIVGGSMVFAWTPYNDEQLDRINARKLRRRQAERTDDGLVDDGLADEGTDR